jgi:hypothetical protein
MTEDMVAMPSKDDYLRETGAEDHIDDKTVFIIRKD